MAQIFIDTQNLNSLGKTMKQFPDVAAKSIPAAINRTLSTANTRMQKEITTKYKIKKSDLSGGSKYKSEKSNNLIKVKKATTKDAQGRIDVRGSTLTLARFLQGNRTPVSHKGKTMAQIKRIRFPKVQVKRGTTKRVGGSFVATAKNATGLFARNENGKLRMLHTLSVAQMAGNQEVLETTQQSAMADLEKRIEHELDYRINKLKGDANGRT